MSNRRKLRVGKAGKMVRRETVGGLTATMRNVAQFPRQPRRRAGQQPARRH
jgi:hypothetical protein